MNILVIDGHKYYSFSEGRLNQTLFNEIVKFLKPNHDIKTTEIEKGYNVEEEIEKFVWADLIIFQTPVNWYSVPGIFKNYIDEVYQYGVFYGPSENYGHGGLLKGKKYMFSLTWGTAEEEFCKPGGFLENKNVDEVFFAVHKINEFCGMEKLETFSLHNVIKNTNIEEYNKKLKIHLEKVIK